MKPPPPATELEPAPAQEQAQALPDDLIEEIFLRLPPDEPDCLVRASLPSRLWLGLLTGARFRGRYREFHGAPPMMGFLRFHGYAERWDGVPIPYLHSTTKFGLDNPDDGWWPLDCRHGRVLLAEAARFVFVVWDPVTGNRNRTKLKVPQTKLKLPDEYIRIRPYSSGAAMLCGCDDHACHESPFGVLFVYLHEHEGDIEDDFIASAHVLVLEPAESRKPYSDVHQWSEACPDIHLDSRRDICRRPPVLAGDAIHFMLSYESRYDAQILKFDFSSCCLSLIDAPLDLIDADLILMGLEDGSLGAAQVDGFTLYRWSRQMGSDGVASWTQLTIIDLENLLPIQNPRPPGWMETPTLVGSVEGSDIIFVTTNLGMYEINLKTRRLKNLRDSEKDFLSARAPVLPYMSFYHPKGLCFLQMPPGKKPSLQPATGIGIYICIERDDHRANIIIMANCAAVSPPLNAEAKALLFPTEFAKLIQIQQATLLTDNQTLAAAPAAAAASEANFTSAHKDFLRNAQCCSG